MKFRRKPKKAATILLIASILMSSSFSTYQTVLAAVKSTPVKLIVNGEELNDLPMSPVILDNYTFVPAREVFEKTGALVSWNQASKEIQVDYDKQNLKIQVDNDTALVNGQEVRMAVPPKIISNKTMIPLRFVSESFGFNVDWDSATNTAAISSNTTSLPPTLDIGILSAVGESIENNTQPYQPQESYPVIPEIPSEPVSTPSPSTDINVESQSLSTLLAIDVSTEQISESKAAETQITAIKSPGENNLGCFSIEASSEISKVSKFLLSDNRLVIDISNAELKMTNTEINVNDNYISKIRAAQNVLEPTKVTRVVFELKSGSEFKVGITPDRKTIKVEFEKNAVTNVEFTSDQISDFITLTFKNSPSANVYPLDEPNRIVIDVPNAELINQVEKTVSGVLSKSIRASQFNATTARIVVDLNEIVMIQTMTQANTLTVKLSRPTFKNIKYDVNKKTIQISKHSGVSTDIANWKHDDQYKNLTYTFTLPGDYSELIGYGEYVLNDIFIKSINIQNNASGLTELSLKENRILAYTVTEDDKYIYIKAMLPLEKYKRVIVLDAGHGGHDNGTSGNGLVEKEINLDITKRVLALIEQEGQMKAYLTRTDDYYPSLEERAIFANSIGDMFISIHSNSADKNPSANGTETLFVPHSNDQTVGLSTKKLAEIMLSSLIKELGTRDRKIQERANIVVLKYTTIPSALMEIAFVSNPSEAAKLATPEFRQKAAQAIYNGILQAYSQYKP